MLSVASPFEAETVAALRMTASMTSEREMPAAFLSTSVSGFGELLGWRLPRGAGAGVADIRFIVYGMTFISGGLCGFPG